MKLTATILITTQNRKGELANAIRSALTQESVSEIVVLDDNSSDGTSDFVRREFPSIRLERSDKTLGIIGARNRGVEIAASSVVITIDDDCVFASPTTVQRTLRDFEDARVGAIAIPHINVNKSPLVHSQGIHVNGISVVSEFFGGSSAIRRDLFVRLGGYNPALWRQCEEYDFCTRLLALGYVTRCGTAEPILHYESPGRDLRMITFNSARGFLLYAWCNVPFWAMVPHVCATVFNCATKAYKTGHLKAAFSGFASAIKLIVQKPRMRRSVPGSAYILMRRLRRGSPVEISRVASALSRPVDCRKEFVSE